MTPSAASDRQFFGAGINSVFAFAPPVVTEQANAKFQNPVALRPSKGVDMQRNKVRSINIYC